VYRDIKQGRNAALWFVLGVSFEVVLHRHGVPHVFERTHRIDRLLCAVLRSGGPRSDDVHHAFGRFSQVLVVLERFELFLLPLYVCLLNGLGKISEGGRLDQRLGVGRARLDAGRFGARRSAKEGRPS
jgi:hypothetical protein